MTDIAKLSLDLTYRLSVLAGQIESTGWRELKNGKKVRITLEECSFSCYEPAAYTLRCCDGLNDGGEFDFDSSRFACEKHRYVERLACQAAGKRGHRVVTRTRLPPEYHETIYDKSKWFDLVHHAFFGKWEQGPNIKEAYVDYKIDFDARVVANIESAATSADKIMAGIVDLSVVMTEEERKEMYRLCDEKFSQYDPIEESAALSADKTIKTSWSDEVDVELFKLNPQATEFVPKRKRGTRAGKKSLMKTKQPGLCYAKLFKMKDRPEVIKKLGFYPRFDKLFTTLMYYKVKPSNYMFEFMDHLGMHCMHVKYQSKWPTCRQIDLIIENHDFYRSVGSDDPENFEEFMGIANYDQEMVDLAQLLVEIENYPKIFEGPYETVGSGEDQEVVQIPVNEPVYVRAPGTCWTKLPGAIQHFCAGFTDRMTLESCIKFVTEILAHNLAWGEFVDYHVKGSRQADGDLHIDAVYTHKVKGAKPISKWIDACKALPMTKLVGKPSPAPVNVALNSLTSHEVRIAVEKQLQNPLVDMIDEAKLICPWRIPETNQHVMGELALPWTLAGPEHPHPIHAAIRRVMYLRELPKHIKCSTTFVGMREESFDMVVATVNRLNPDNGWTFKLINPIVDVRDLSRYAASGSVPEDFWTLPKITTPAIHFDESWHYLSEAFCIHLRRVNPGLVFMTGISIFPLIALEMEQSPTPDLFAYEVIGSIEKPQLVYWMEGNVREKYVQPFNPSIILANRIESEDGKILWSGGPVTTLLNTRLHVFSAFHLAAPRVEVLIERKYIQLPRVFRNQAELPMIPLDHFEKLCDYARVMPQSKSETVWAKWRLMMKENGIHLPWGYKEAIIDVVMECKRLSQTQKLQSRDITGVSHEAYYQTIGKLMKWYERRFVCKYNERRMNLISQQSPNMVFELIAVTVRDRGSDVYGIAWKVPMLQKDGRNWWGKFKYWLKSHGYKGLTPEQVLTDTGGHIRFPFLSNTWLNQSHHGIYKIQQSQAKAFHKVYDLAKDSTVKEVEQIQLTAPVEVSEISSDSESYKEPEDILPLEELDEDHPNVWGCYDHCATCMPYHEWVANCGALSRDSYIKGCESAHAAGTFLMSNESKREKNLLVSMLQNSVTRRTSGPLVEVEEGPVQVPKPIRREESKPIRPLRAREPLTTKTRLETIMEMIAEEEGNESTDLHGEDGDVVEMPRVVLEPDGDDLPVGDEPPEEPVRVNVVTTDGQTEKLMKSIAKGSLLTRASVSLGDANAFYDDTLDPGVVHCPDHSTYAVVGESGPDYSRKQKMSCGCSVAQEGDHEVRAGLHYNPAPSWKFQIANPETGYGKKNINMRPEVPKDRNPVVLSQPVRKTKVKTTWADHQLAWSKKVKMLSTVRTMANDRSGVLFWDTAYPLTESRRYSNIPYRQVRVYPKVPYPENDCLLVALSEVTQISPADVYYNMMRAFPASQMNSFVTLREECIWPFACHMGIAVIVHHGRTDNYYGCKELKLVCTLDYKDGHYTGGESLRVPMRIKSYIKPVFKRPSKLMQNLQAWEAMEFSRWIPEASRADKCRRALAEGEIGLINTPINQEKLVEWDNQISAGFPKDQEIMFGVCCGDPGSRKSTTPQRYMKGERRWGDWNAVLPTAQLRRDWADKLDAMSRDNNGKAMDGTMLSTWESALAKYISSQTLVLDENKYPPGYIAMYAILNPTVKNIVFLGDPWQANWHWPTPTRLNEELSEMQYYMNYAKGYIIGTWRFAGMSAAFWRMPSYSRNLGNWAFTRAIPATWEALKQYFPWENDSTLLDMWAERQEYTAAHFQAQFAEEIRQSDARSFSASIGVTVPLAIIHIDEGVLRGSDCRLIYTAMTRSWNIIFVINWVHNRTAEQHMARHPVFSKLEYYRQNYVLGKRTEFNPDYSVSIRECTEPFPDHLKLWMAGPFEKCTNFDQIKQWWPKESWANTIDPDATRGGARLSENEPAYEGQWHFHPFIDPIEEYHEVPGVTDPIVQEVSPVPVKVKTSIPPGDRVGFVEFHSAQVKERFEAELQVKGHYSAQFEDLPRQRFDSAEIFAQMVESTSGSTKRVRKARALERIKQIKGTADDPTMTHDPILLWAAFQRSDDHVTWLASKQQRIRFSSIAQNLANLQEQTNFGLQCWESFRLYMGWENPVPWDENRYHACVERFQEKRGERTEALKKGSLNRADPNFEIMVNLKQQLKLKDEEWKPAKAAQPVWIHPDHQLFTEGPYGMLLLDLLLEHKPPYWHFHARESYDSFATWVDKYLADVQMFSMNDLVGQDQSCQGWAVTVLKQMMMWFNFPEHAIHEFVNNKLIKSLGGKAFIAIMTDSGEVWTFLINTVSSTARECFMYDLKPGFPQANGGDDTMSPLKGPINPDYEAYRLMDPCTDKRYDSERGDFTAHCVKNGVLFRNPIILLKRFMVRVAAGKGEDAVLGYGDAWAHNYALSEKLVGAMREDELEAHAIMTRIFMNLKREGLKTRMDWSKRYDFEFESIPELTEKDHKLVQDRMEIAPVWQTSVSNEIVGNSFVQSWTLPMSEYTSAF